MVALASSHSEEIRPDTDIVPSGDSAVDETEPRTATFERDGHVVMSEEARARAEQTSRGMALRYVADLNEDVSVTTRGPDAPSRLTAAGEALELVIGDRQGAEACYRRALRSDATCREAHESLRRLHRAQGNWRTVAQLVEQELTASTSPERRAQLRIALELIHRTRSESGASPGKPLAASVVDGVSLATSRLVRLLEASQLMWRGQIEKALAVRGQLAALDVELNLDEDDGDETGFVAEPSPEELRDFQEWTWSEANLRRFLLDDSARATELLLAVFDSGRRDPELLDALSELLADRRDWDRLRSVYEAAVEAGTATAADYEALSSLLLTRYRDTAAAAEVLHRGTEVFPGEPTLARRLVEALSGTSATETLIDALGNLLEVTPSAEDRAELLWRLGHLFEAETGLTSAAIEVFQEAIAASPRHGATLRALGRIYHRQQNWIGLSDLYEKELASPDDAPDGWRRHYQLATLYEEQLENTTAALRHFQAVLREKPGFRPAMDGVERLLKSEGEYELLARILFDTAQRMGPGNRRNAVLEQAARTIEQHLDDDLLLREVLLRLLETSPDHTYGLEALGRLHRRGREWDELITVEERRASLAGHDEDAATCFWTCGRIAGRYLSDSRRAEAYFRRALSVCPDFVPALTDFGRLLVDESRFEELLEIAEAECDVLEPLAKVRRMEAMAELLDQFVGRRAAAIDMYERVLTVCPEDTTAMRRLVALYSEQGRWDQVSELLERQAGLGPAESAAERWYKLAEVRERKLGDDAGATDAFARCLAVCPDHVHAQRGLLRTASSAGRDVTDVMKRVAEDCTDLDVQRIALRHLAREAERSSGDPTAGLDHRRQAVAANPQDREARDVLEAAFAKHRDLPGLAGVWAAAGRTIDEGLLGLMAASAGISAESLITTFLARWGNELEEQLNRDERYGLFNAALGEVSRCGLGALGKAELGQTVWNEVTGPARRRAALEMMSHDDGVAHARRFLAKAAPAEPGSLRLVATLSGDDDVRIDATRTEVDNLATPELRVRRLLELARLDPKRQREYFERAVAQEAFDSPVIEQLYEALDDAEVHDLLRAALEAHLCSEGLSVARRSHLAFWLGQTIERAGGEDFDALCAYRTSFQSGHERHEALLEMARLTEALGDKWDAMRCLEAFMTLSMEVDQRCVAGLHLAKLYLAEAPTPTQQQQGYDPYAGPIHYDGGPFGHKALDLLSRLREEARGTELEWTVAFALANAHTQVGSPYRAVELLQEIIVGSGSSALAESLALVDLYCDPLGDFQNASQLLAHLFEAYPHNVDVRERLLQVSRRSGNLHEALDTIEHAARHGSPEVLTASQRRQLLEMVANLLGDELGRHAQAAGIWRELADGAYTETDVRLYRSREARALCRVAGEESRCHGLLLDLNNEDPYECETYEALEVLYREVQDHERLRTIGQIRSVLDPEAVEMPQYDGVRRKVHPSRAFDNELLAQHLVPDELQGGVFDVLVALVPLAIKCFGDQIPSSDALGGKRWRGNDEHDTVMQFAETASETFDLNKIRIQLGDSGPNTPQILGSGSSVTLWFHRGMFEGVGPEVGRFLAGFAAGLAWSGLSPLTHLDGRDLWHLLDAVLIKQTGVGLTDVTDPRSLELIPRVGGAFNRSLRKRVVEAATPCIDALRNAHCEAWPAAIRKLGTRAGLVLSGQISGATQAILRSREWRGHLLEADTQAHMRKLPEVADLFQFALSDDYLALRHGCGLAARARRIA